MYWDPANVLKTRPKELGSRTIWLKQFNVHIIIFYWNVLCNTKVSLIIKTSIVCSIDKTTSFWWISKFLQVPPDSQLITIFSLPGINSWFLRVHLNVLQFENLDSKNGTFPSTDWEFIKYVVTTAISVFANSNYCKLARTANLVKVRPTPSQGGNHFPETWKSLIRLETCKSLRNLWKSIISQKTWTFSKLLVFSTKVNLLYLLYSMAWSCCLLHLMKENCLLKTFLRTLILVTQVSLYLLSLLELISNCIIFL